MKKNSFVEGTFIATFAIVFSKFLGMIYVIPFYAIIGQQGGALYSYAYNIYLLFLGISTAGLPIAMSKLISEYNTLDKQEAKERSYKIARNIILFISIIAFFVLFMFAEEFASLILGDITGGNSIQDVALTVRAVSFCLLIIPFLSVTRGYLQGHKFISPPSISQVIEQIVRIVIILAGSYTVMNILKGSVATAVSISVFAAFLAGLAAYIYLKIVMHKNKDKLNLPKKNARDDVSTREIVKKIIMYSLPLIIVNVAINVYNLIDLVFINHGLFYLGYSGPETETITSIVSTWSTKICMMITAIGTGLSTSLIPHITSSFVKKDMSEVRKNFNRAIQIVIVVSVPMAIGIAVLSTPMYTIFFGESKYGPMILAMSVFISALANIHIISNMALQSLNKFKLVYVSTLIGFITNAILDLPLIFLFNKLGIYPFFGAMTASVIGYFLSFMIACINLKKDKNIKMTYSSTLKVLKDIFIPTALMTIILLIMNLFMPIHNTNFFVMLGTIIVYALVGMAIYLPLLYKNGTLEKVFGKPFLDKILNKFKRNNAK